MYLNGEWNAFCLYRVEQEDDRLYSMLRTIGWGQPVVTPQCHSRPA